MNTKLKISDYDVKDLGISQLALLKLIVHSEKQILDNKTKEQKDVFKFIEKNSLHLTIYN